MKYGADDSGKTFGPPASYKVTWTVTHLATGQVKEHVEAQTAYGAAYMAGWPLSECVTKRES